MCYRRPVPSIYKTLDFFRIVREGEIFGNLLRKTHRENERPFEKGIEEYIGVNQEGPAFAPLLEVPLVRALFFCNLSLLIAVVLRDWDLALVIEQVLFPGGIDCCWKVN